MATVAAGVLDAGAWLVAQAAAQVGTTFPDTIVTKQAPIDPGWFEQVQQVLSAITTLAIGVLTIAVVPAAWNFRKSYQKVSDLLDKVYADVSPISHHAARISENVDYVTTAVRADTERASALLNNAETRLRAALDRAEARARDLEALVAVAQQEAERSIVSAASTVAGVREGVASLRDDLVAAVVGPRGDVRDAEDVAGDDVALVEVRRGRGAEALRPGFSHASGVPGAYAEDVIDADDITGNPAAGRPRVRPRDRG